MFKFLLCLTSLLIMFNSCSCSNCELLKENVMIEAFYNGKQIQLDQKDCQEFDSLFAQALKDSRAMPAFAVSLHDDTMQNVQNGLWIRFVFTAKIEVNGMPFDQLLITIEKDMHGFNVIRGNNGRFEGRCYYISLSDNLDNVYNFLTNKNVGEKDFSAIPSKQTLAEEIRLKEVADLSTPCFSENIPSVNKDKDNPNGVMDMEKSNKNIKKPMDKSGLFEELVGQQPRNATEVILQAIEF